MCDRERERFVSILLIIELGETQTKKEIYMVIFKTIEAEFSRRH